MGSEKDWIELIATDAPLFEDRRTELRLPAEGQVRVSLKDSDTVQEFHADLVNLSQRGMCIRHTFQNLKPCQTLRVFCDGSEIEAEVAWNWAVGAVIISGLRSVS
ncbi:MAG TPA: PilZ domain-containing protein [Terriglobales bacterium]|nr:PilZ domain-containing protein [Terriglobales bacterium]